MSDIDAGQRAADLIAAALDEVGRHDLALLVHVFEDDDGSFYLESPDDLHPRSPDLALMYKAERIALGHS